MADRNAAGTAEAEIIDIESDDDIRRWAHALGVTNVAVLDAVEKVGPRVDNVRRHLDAAMVGRQADG